MRLGGSLVSLAAASSWSSDSSAAGTGADMPEARSRLKITLARSGTQSAGAPLPRSRATAQTAAPAAEAPSATWSGMRSASAPANRGAAAASAAPTAIRRFHQSTRFDSGCAAQCGEAGVTSPRARSRTASRTLAGRPAERTLSVVSTLVGIAIGDGKISSPGCDPAELLPDNAAQMSPDQRSITLRHLLTMSAGSLTRWRSPTQRRQGRVDPEVAVRGYFGNPVHLLRSRSALVLAIVAEASGMTTLDYARAKLFGPLGINSTPAYTSSRRRGGAGSSSRWFLKFGW
jgi:hypothetical protein